MKMRPRKKDRRIQKTKRGNQRVTKRKCGRMVRTMKMQKSRNRIRYDSRVHVEICY